MGIKENNLNMKALSERMDELERLRAETPVISREEIAQMRELLLQYEAYKAAPAEEDRVDGLTKEVARIKEGLSRTVCQDQQARSQIQSHAQRLTELEKARASCEARLESKPLGEDMFVWSSLSVLGKLMVAGVLSAAVIGILACFLMG